MTTDFKTIGANFQIEKRKFSQEFFTKLSAIFTSEIASVDTKLQELQTQYDQDVKDLTAKKMQKFVSALKLQFETDSKVLTDRKTAIKAESDSFSIENFISNYKSFNEKYPNGFFESDTAKTSFESFKTEYATALPTFEKLKAEFIKSVQTHFAVKENRASLNSIELAKEILLINADKISVITKIAESEADFPRDATGNVIPRSDGIPHQVGEVLETKTIGEILIENGILKTVDDEMSVKRTNFEFDLKNQYGMFDKLRPTTSKKTREKKVDENGKETETEKEEIYDQFYAKVTTNDTVQTFSADATFPGMESIFEKIAASLNVKNARLTTTINGVKADVTEIVNGTLKSLKYKPAGTNGVYTSKWGNCNNYTTQAERIIAKDPAHTNALYNFTKQIGGTGKVVLGVKTKKGENYEMPV